MGLLLGTILFLVIGGGGYVYVNATRPGLNNLLPHTLWGTTVVCCWMMWAIIHIAQTYPLIRPILQS